MKTVRREIQAIRRGTGGLLDVLLQQVWTYLTAGDSANALALMEVLANQDVPELSFASWHQSEIWDEGDRGIETVALSPRVA